MKNPAMRRESVRSPEEAERARVPGRRARSSTAVRSTRSAGRKTRPGRKRGPFSSGAPSSAGLFAFAQADRRRASAKPTRWQGVAHVLPVDDLAPRSGSPPRMNRHERHLKGRITVDGTMRPKQCIPEHGGNGLLKLNEHGFCLRQSHQKLHADALTSCSAYAAIVYGSLPCQMLSGQNA